MARRLGQHFLADPAILDRIVAGLDSEADDAVLEIGAGLGTLTRRLATRVRRVVTIEADGRLAAALEAARSADDPARLPDNVTVVHGDALRLDWHALMQEVSPTPRLPPRASDRKFPGKVIGNIPYYITAPLIDKALTPPIPPVIVFLVQREVADRLAADPGSRAYGALTVGVRAVATVERLFAVRRGAFRPPPAVDSAVVRFRPLEVPLVPSTATAGFRRFVVALFGQRRKQIGTSLKSIFGVDRDAADALAASVGFDVRARPETLHPETLATLYAEVDRRQR